MQPAPDGGKRRILLVDDEPRIVQGLQRALRMHRDSWEVLIATSGPAALAIVEQAGVDVIISDMRMPEMDGATLLGHVRDHHPATMRIVLSGQTDADAAFRAMPVAHQFLNKPTDPASVGEILVRTSAMKDALPDPELHAALGGLDALPSPRHVRDDLGIAIVSNASLDVLVSIVERDPALVLKLLQTVNSAFFGLRRRISDVAEAVAYLGIDLVQKVCAVGGAMRAHSLIPTMFDVGQFHDRAFSLASLARNVAGGGERGAVAFAAGLFYEIGRLAIAATSSHVEDDRHLAVAAYLLDLWGIPRAVVDALVQQGEIEANLDSRTKLTPADALWVARRMLARESVDDAYLQRIGVKLEVWRAA